MISSTVINMDNKPKLVSWSLHTTHLHFDEDLVLPNGTVIPAGTLCGRHPSKKGRMGIWSGKSYDALHFEFGSWHLWGMKFCRGCAKKIIQYGMADKMGLPSGQIS